MGLAFMAAGRDGRGALLFVRFSLYAPIRTIDGCVSSAAPSATLRSWRSTS
ncbi:hypothetical protein RAJCM14343_6009 [Rhodococcus aetherivorans]|uniref:Uncharacterized protein n=1 Tax=Rhodococcus aetherivorans TaxID=191292 RepID=A0ABQ0YVV4_9NOCA|nr:hypothetical protein RAJCM14343_6009 [Rhodococcus aetherivorans]